MEPTKKKKGGQFMRPKTIINMLLTWILAFTMLEAATTNEVTGRFIGNGKNAKLAHAWVAPYESWQGEEAFIIVLSEKPATDTKQPDFDAFFGNLDSALIVKFTKSGDIFGTEVYHESHEKKPFSSVGPLKLRDFKFEGDIISGRLFTEGTVESFGTQTWEVDLTFKAKLSK